MNYPPYGGRKTGRPPARRMAHDFFYPEKTRKQEADARNVRQMALNIALADPTNITSVRHGNCRWCWGDNNEYQRYDWELERDLNRFLAASKKGSTFNQMGGGGFIRTKDPNPKCPICAGEGEPYVRIEDFRNLNNRDKHLIAGIKVGKGGVIEEIKFHNKIDAIMMFAKIEGMITEKKVVKVLEASEEDLNQYFSGVTIDMEDPDVRSFIEDRFQEGAGVPLDEAGMKGEVEPVGMEPPRPETIKERLARLKQEWGDE